MNDDKFEYTYSAPNERERREIECIRNSYAPESAEKPKIDRLRALDKKVKNIPCAVAATVGTTGVLAFGAGLSMILSLNLTAWGIALAAVGSVIFGLAFPLRKIILKKMKSKYGGTILRLSEELLNETDKS